MNDPLLTINLDPLVNIFGNNNEGEEPALRLALPSDDDDDDADEGFCEPSARCMIMVLCAYLSIWVLLVVALACVHASKKKQNRLQH